MAETTLHDWLQTPLGRYVLQMEQALLDDVVANCFGFNALQVCWPELEGLRTNRIPNRMTLSFAPGGNLRADPREIPLQSESVDLVILPHALEFSANPHAILREVQRIMRPEGRLVVLGFNPRSLWGLRRLLARGTPAVPWCGQFISLPRLKDWLSLLSFDVQGGRFRGYAPPVASERWLGRFAFMEPAGDRWWGVGGGLYMIEAVKRVHGMRLITPRWQQSVVPEPALASAVRAAVRRGRSNVIPFSGPVRRPTPHETS